MKKILVPTDFSPVSINALHYAAELSNQLGAQLVLFHAFQLPVSMSEIPMITMPYEELKKISEDHLKELTAGLERVNPGTQEITSVCAQGMVNEELEAAVSDIHPFAVVMGTRGSGGLERVFLGSNTLSAIKTLRCPVIVVPPGAKYRKIEKIGLAVDLKSVKETLPVNYVKEICTVFGAKLFVLNIDKEEKNFKPETLSENFHLHQALDQLNPEYHFIDNADFEKGIHDFAEKNNLDLIINIPKKHSLLETLFQKSHTADLVFHSHIPICSIHG
ncbi:universal stress protein [Pollutibacter soli]|uniref:universal stress protein n=1 Tax=Pollutibacter soli TaxID=3034157 RepID=UPI00301331D1